MREYFNGPYRHTFRESEMDSFGWQGGWDMILLNMIMVIYRCLKMGTW
jgi:hypothetical protein